MVGEPHGKVEFVGNRTECALLMMLRNWGRDYRELRDVNHDNTLGALSLRRRRLSVAGTCLALPLGRALP